MPDQLQLRGGTTSEHNSFTGVTREVTVDTTKKTLVVHDGSTAGGTPLMKEGGSNHASAVAIGTGGTNAINIDSNQKVGIGASAPQHTLTVRGGTDTLAIQSDVSASSGQDKGGILGLGGKFNNNGGINDYANYGEVRGLKDNNSNNQNGGYLSFFTKANGQTIAERMRITSSGNVGIGAQNPARPLEVNGGIRLSNDSVIEWGGTTTAIYGSSGSNVLFFKTGGAEKMRLTNTGDLIIGATTTPQGRIEVAKASGGSNFDAINLRNHAGDANSAVTLNFIKSTDATNTAARSYIRSTRSGSNSYLDIATSNSPAIRITTDGKVGMGSNLSSIDAALTVNRDIAQTASLNRSNQTMILKNSGTSNADSRTSLYFSSYNASNQLAPAAIACLAASNYKSDLAFYTNNNGNGTGHLESNERMRITTDGKVGINDATPSKTLDITGENSGNGEINVKRTNGATCMIQAQAATAVFGASSNHAMQLKTNGTTAFTIDTSQRSGIGTSSPSARLHVVETASTVAQKIKMGTNTNQNVHLELENNSTAKLKSGVFGSGANAYGVISANNGFISSTDNLAIETSSDTGIIKFGVGSGGSTEHMRIKADGDIQMRRQTSGGSFETLLISANYGSGSDQALQASNSLRLYSGGANERMRVSSAGQIGIGTSSPSSSYALEIHKSSSTTGIPLCVRNPDKTNGSATSIRFQSTNSTDAAWHLGELRFINMDNYGQYSDFALYTHALGSTTETLRVKGSNKRLGFGTTSPHNKFHQHESSSGSNYHQFTNSTTGSGAGDGAVVGLDGNELLLVWNQEDNPIKFGTNDTERVRIDENGNVGIGTTNLINNAGYAGLTLNGSSGGIISLKDSDVERGRVGLVGENNLVVQGPPGASATITFDKLTHDGSNNVNGATEMGRFNPSGHFLVGTTSDNIGINAATEGIALREEGHVVSRGTSSNAAMFTAKTTDTGGSKAFRVMLAQTEIGSIGMGSGGTTFNTSSDYRRKENVVTLTNAITRLKTLAPKRFNFKTEPSVTRDGFLAHEVTAVPEAVTGLKDAVATEADVTRGVSDKVGDPIYQQLDQSKLVPLLTAALQEAVSKIETLEAKVAALEAA